MSTCMLFLSFEEGRRMSMVILERLVIPENIAKNRLSRGHFARRVLL